MGALAGLGALVGGQLWARALSFGLHAAVTRRAAPADMALAAFVPELLAASIASLCREPARTAAVLHAQRGSKRNVDVVCGFGWTALLRLPPVFAAFVALHVAFGGAHATPLYWVLLFCAMALDSLAEPWRIRLLCGAMLRRRAAADSAGAVLGAAATLGSARLGLPVPLAFALGRLVTSFAVCAIFAVVVPLQYAQAFAGFRYPSPALVAAASSNLVSALCQYGAARGDAWLVAACCRPEGRGLYAVASSWGSLACRVFLQPFEEAVFVAATRDGDDVLPRVALSLAATVCAAASLAAPLAAPVFVRALLAPRWSDAGLPRVLAAYGLQVGAMALCGTAESLARATDHGTVRHRLRAVSLAVAAGQAALMWSAAGSLAPEAIILVASVAFAARFVAACSVLDHCRRSTFLWKVVVLVLCVACGWMRLHVPSLSLAVCHAILVCIAIAMYISAVQRILRARSSRKTE